jgi:hypothetical protein
MPSDATNIDATLLESGAWYTPLPALEFTLCEGVDNARFLQGQLSCNLNSLSTSQSLRGALCNLKGRVITNLRVLLDDRGILLLTQYAMREKLIGTLDKYRVFFKTSLSPVHNGMLALGLGGPDFASVAESMGIALPTHLNQTCLHSGLRIICLTQSPLNKFPRFLCVVDTTDAIAQQTIQQLMQQLLILPDDLWQLADMRDGEVNIRPEQTELFTPQLLNYDINGVIDYKKGCYTGQEIVARMHYRAEAKRRLYHCKVATGVTYKSGDLSSYEDTIAQLQLADGSIESLIILNVGDAANNPDITGFS